MAAQLTTFGMLVLALGTFTACAGMLKMGTVQQRRHALAQQHNERLTQVEADLRAALEVGGPEPESSKAMRDDEQFNDIAGAELSAAARPNKAVFIGWGLMAIGAFITVSGSALGGLL